MNTPTEATDFGIAPLSAARLRRLFGSTPRLRRVWIVGSRATGSQRTESDIDLAVEPPAGACTSRRSGPTRCASSACCKRVRKAVTSRASGPASSKSADR